MRTTILSYLLVIAYHTAAQDSITLLECHRLSLENAPGSENAAIIREIGYLKEENSGIAWLPELNLNGKMSYQSDVVSLALEGSPIPVQFPEVPNDQYGLNLDINQTLYDGGITGRKKAYELAAAAAEMQQAEVDLYSLKDRVNQLYFAILIIQENLRNLGLHMDNLQTRREVLCAAIENGAALKADISVINVELLKLKQSFIELDSRRKAFLETLGLICGSDFPEGIALKRPRLERMDKQEGSRPEYRLFDLKEASLEAGKELIARKRMPVVFAFGQTGYGKPGYNMLNNEWDFYYMFGAGIRWNLWDWSSSSRERQVIEHRQELLRNRKEAFNLEIEAQLVQEEAKIRQYMESMELEEEVLELQEEITEVAATRLSNGTITATDYITELNREMMARINVTTREIRMMHSIANYLTIQGKLW